MRVYARARASLALGLPIQCHRHISTEPPPPGGTRDWLSPEPAPPPPGPPSLSRAPINQPRGCQSPGCCSPRRPAARAAATAIASPGRGRGSRPRRLGVLPGLRKQSAVSFRRGRGGVIIPQWSPPSSSRGAQCTSSYLVHLPGAFPQQARYPRTVMRLGCCTERGALLPLARNVLVSAVLLGGSRITFIIFFQHPLPNR